MRKALKWIIEILSIELRCININDKYKSYKNYDNKYYKKTGVIKTGFLDDVAHLVHVNGGASPAQVPELRDHCLTPVLLHTATQQPSTRYTDS